MPFRSRGRPSRSYCDLASQPMTQQEFIPNRSEHIAMMASQHEELSAAISNQREFMAGHNEVSLMSNHSNDSSNGPSMTTAAMETDDVTVTATTEPSNGTDSPVGHDEQNLSLSVEIAAVNQAILALTGQQPIEVKLENGGGDSNLASS